LKSEELKDIVKQVYAARVKGGFDAGEDEGGECGCGEEHGTCSCAEENEACDCEAHESCECGNETCDCDEHEPEDPNSWSLKVGYSQEDMEAVPEGCNLGLGCGNPVASADLKEGEVILDLGCGAGFDVFLAANQVGKKGRVIGVDMTPEMVEAGQEHAKNGKYKNVEFRVGDMEKLPVEDGAVDVIISNCSINLVPDKMKVFNEAFRALKTGGRLIVTDIVLLAKLPDEIQNSLEGYVGCIAGAALKDDYLKMIKDAGFMGLKVINDAELKQAKEHDQPIFSIKLQAFKK
jgi:SAM-dependent methyltransferase